MLESEHTPGRQAAALKELEQRWGDRMTVEARQAFEEGWDAALAEQPREEPWETLRPYLGHVGGCAIYKPVPSACDCGLAELRAALNAEEHQQAGGERTL